MEVKIFEGIRTLGRYVPNVYDNDHHPSDRRRWLRDDRPRLRERKTPTALCANRTMTP